MRNLKRVLSLALALVMMLGMMIIGASAASADFPDAAEIDYTEAVDVISGLGIMTGDDKGNFNPDSILTREQAAKIICYTLIGAENADKLGNNTQIFTDVAAGRWSAGYIAYCANLGILVGDGNGKFRPEDYLTGVQFGKMLLVAAGYNAETQGYLGADWATNIATDMIDNDLDIKGVILSDNLKREQAAQMLLQAMDMDTVTYTTGNVVGMIGPFPAEETFAEKYFPKLEKIEGVVTANEYADLDSSKPLRAGKTEIGGKTYTGTTALTDIGESRVGWANNGKILYLADSGKNTVFQTGAATKLDTKFKKANGIDDDDAEWYVNFGGDNDAYDSDYRIEYTLKFADAADVDEFEDEYDVTLGDALSYNKVFKVGATISANELGIIKGIFYSADYEEDIVLGEVYVGTKSNEDVSDKISYKTFYNEYINDGTEYDAFNSTKNGEWLKVVDNDNDGEADYVFKTEFTLDEVQAVSKKGAVTLTGDVTLDADEYVASEDLAKGDVVLTATIDGITYISLAPSFTGEVDSYSMKKDILTVEGEEYGQSGIGNVTSYVELIAYAEKKTDYTFYQDFFGYIRAFAYPTDAEGQYLLLTDGWYNETRTKDEYAVKAYLDGEIQDVDVNAKKTGDFVDDSALTQNNSWGNLIAFNDYDNHAAKGYTGDAITNIAAYALNDNVLSLNNVKTYTYNKKHVETSVKTDYVDLDVSP